MNDDALLQLLESQTSINSRYSKLQRISTSPGGGGNFPLIFKAYDQQSGKVVVLKFDHPWVSDKYRHECFEREAALLARFSGELNIVELVEGISTFLYSVTLPNGQIFPIPFRFIALEAARFSLFEYIHQPKKKYGPLRNLLYFREVCKEVQRLHSAKVCHRDLKPQNCLVMTGSYVALAWIIHDSDNKKATETPNCAIGAATMRLLRIVERRLDGDRLYTATEV